MNRSITAINYFSMYSMLVVGDAARDTEGGVMTQSISLGLREVLVNCVTPKALRLGAE